MKQPGGSVVAGRILMVAGLLSAVGGALFLAGMVPVARFTGLLVGGVLVVAGLVDIFLGQRLVRREER
jgi:hypothetical protein